MITWERFKAKVIEICSGEEEPRRAHYDKGESYCAMGNEWGCERQHGHEGKHMAWERYSDNPSMRVLYPNGEWE